MGGTFTFVLCIACMIIGLVIAGRGRPDMINEIKQLKTKAIEVGAAQYNPTTSKFEWIADKKKEIFGQEK